MTSFNLSAWAITHRPLVHYFMAMLVVIAVALGSRPGKPAYFSPTPPTVAGALAKTAALFLARFVARRAIAAAANQGARKLASAWPL